MLKKLRLSCLFPKVGNTYDKSRCNLRGYDTYPHKLIVAVMFFLHACSWSSDFKKAQTLKGEGKFHSAIEYYLAFVEDKPNHKNAPQALLEVGRIQEELLEEIDQAIETYRTMAAFYPITDSTILAQERLAKLYKHKKNNHRQALTEFSKLIRAVPYHQKVPEFQMEVADCYTLLHQYSQAELEYQVLIDDYPKFKGMDEVYFKKANNNYINGSYDTAIQDYIHIIKNMPDSKFVTEAKFGLGATYEEIDDFENAKAYYAQIKKTYPSPKVIELRIKGIEKRSMHKNTIKVN